MALREGKGGLTFVVVYFRQRVCCCGRISSSVVFAAEFVIRYCFGGDIEHVKRRIATIRHREGARVHYRRYWDACACYDSSEVGRPAVGEEWCAVVAHVADE